MSPTLKPTENVLIDYMGPSNGWGLQADEKCYFLNYDRSQSAGNVRT